MSLWLIYFSEWTLAGFADLQDPYQPTRCYSIVCLPTTFISSSTTLLSYQIQTLFGFYPPILRFKNPSFDFHLSTFSIPALKKQTNHCHYFVWQSLCIQYSTSIQTGWAIYDGDEPYSWSPKLILLSKILNNGHVSRRSFPCHWTRPQYFVINIISWSYQELERKGHPCQDLVNL